VVASYQLFTREIALFHPLEASYRTCRLGKQKFCTMVSKCMYCAAVVVAPMHELQLFRSTLTPNWSALTPQSGNGRVFSSWWSSHPKKLELHYRILSGLRKTNKLYCMYV